MKGHLRHAEGVRPTDNLSTGLDDYLGDIAIAPAVARANAKELGRTFNVEMRILILHGILHLMGYDHETDDGQMERREMRLRRALGLAK
jgi:probable rRNA maturation factor